MNKLIAIHKALKDYMIRNQSHYRREKIKIYITLIPNQIWDNITKMQLKTMIRRALDGGDFSLFEKIINKD